MAAQTDIGWTDSTHNHWVGCTKISPACDNCYAEALMDKRLHRVGWGAGKPRVLTSEANRRKPLQWNEVPFHECTECGWRGERKQCAYWESPVGFLPKVGPAWSCPKCHCEAVQSRRRVFCSSLADVFDNEVPAEWLADLLDLIRRTPNIDWLLLTKRIGNWRSRIQAAIFQKNYISQELATWLGEWHDGKRSPANVWIGATICNQIEADRDVPKLLRVPAAVRFLSIEPMLSGINFRWRPYAHQAAGETYREYLDRVGGVNEYESLKGIDWMIDGGESGVNARPSNPQWFRENRDQCAAAGLAYFHKQNGEFVSVSEVEGPGEHYTFADGRTVRRTGKKIAGRTLDGVIHNEFPRNLAQR